MTCDVCGDPKFDVTCPACFIGYAIHGVGYLQWKFMAYEGFLRYDGRFDGAIS